MDVCLSTRDFLEFVSTLPPETVSTLHGMVVVALPDETLVWAWMERLGQFCSTLSTKL